MKKVLAILVLLVVSAIASDPIVLSNFLGLNTIDGDLVVDRRFARVANNIDLSRGGKNVIARRDGFALVDSMPTVDSVVSMYVYNRLDGNKQLVIVADDSTASDSGLGTVWKTQINSDRLDSLTKIISRWCVTARSSFATFNDNLIGVNGTSYGLLHRRNITREFPIRSPAEPKIIPLKKAGSPNGDIYYVMKYVAEDDTTAGFRNLYRSAGYLCRPVRVRNQQVMITGFQWQPVDSISAQEYSLIYPYRVKQSDLPITRSTYAFKVNGVGYATSSTPNALAAKAFIDTCGDAGLSTTDSVAIFGYPLQAVVDQSGLGVHYQYGSPVYISTDTGLGTLGGIWQDTGSSILDSNFVKGWAVTYTYVDTVTGMESDTAPALWIMRQSKKSRGFTFRLPQADSAKTGLRINIYRAPIIGITYKIKDSLSHLDSVMQRILNIIDPGHQIEYKPPEFFDFPFAGNGRNLLDTVEAWLHRPGTRPDTFLLGTFYLREQVNVRTDSNVTYYDTLRFDSLSRIPFTFRKNFPPYFMEKVQIADNRLIIQANGNIYYSNMDSVSEFGLMNFRVLSNYDGDRNTIAFQARQALRVFQNNSNWNLYGDNYRPEIVGHWGCIAPESHAAGENGHFYLANEGVYFEEEGPTLERTVQAGLISAPLASFKNASVTTKSEAVGRFLPTQRKYLLSMGDSTWNYDVPSQGWTTWTGLTFADGVLYDTGAANKFHPGTTFYFTKHGSKAIYRYPSGSTDAGTNVVMTYQSPPLWAGLDYLQPLSVAMICRNVSADYLYGQFLDYRDTVLVTKAMDSLSKSLREWKIQCPASQLASFRLSNLTVGAQFDSGYVDAIIINARKVSENEDR